MGGGGLTKLSWFEVETIIREIHTSTIDFWQILIWGIEPEELPLEELSEIPLPSSVLAPENVDPAAQPLAPSAAEIAAETFLESISDIIPEPTIEVATETFLRSISNTIPKPNEELAAETFLESISDTVPEPPAEATPELYPESVPDNTAQLAAESFLEPNPMFATEIAAGPTAEVANTVSQPALRTVRVLAEPALLSASKSTPQSTPRSASKSTSKSASKSASKSTSQSVPEDVKTVAESASQSIPYPTYEPSAEDCAKITSRSAPKNDMGLADPALISTPESASESTSKSTSKAASESISKSTSKSTSSKSKSASKWTSKRTSKKASKSASKATSKPITEVVSQSNPGNVNTVAGPASKSTSTAEDSAKIISQSLLESDERRADPALLVSSESALESTLKPTSTAASESTLKLTSKSNPKSGSKLTSLTSKSTSKSASKSAPKSTSKPTAEIVSQSSPEDVQTLAEPSLKSTPTTTSEPAAEDIAEFDFKSVSGISTQQVTKSIPRSTPKFIDKVAAEPTAKAVAGNISKSTPETFRTLSEPALQSTPESTAGPIAEAVARFNPESVHDTTLPQIDAEPITKVIAKVNSQPIPENVEAFAESALQSIQKTISEPTAQVITEKYSQSNPGITPQQATKSTSESALKSSIEFNAQASKDVVAKILSPSVSETVKPFTEPASQSILRQTSEPTGEAVVEHDSESNPKITVQLAAKSVLESTPKSSTEIAAGSTAKIAAKVISQSVPGKIKTITELALQSQSTPEPSSKSTSEVITKTVSQTNLKIVEALTEPALSSTSRSTSEPVAEVVSSSIREEVARQAETIARHEETIESLNAIIARQTAIIARQATECARQGAENARQAATIASIATIERLAAEAGSRSISESAIINFGSISDTVVRSPELLIPKPAPGYDNRRRHRADSVEFIRQRTASREASLSPYERTADFPAERQPLTGSFPLSSILEQTLNSQVKEISGEEIVRDSVDVQSASLVPRPRVGRSMSDSFLGKVCMDGQPKAANPTLLGDDQSDEGSDGLRSESLSNAPWAAQLPWFFLTEDREFNLRCMAAGMAGILPDSSHDRKSLVCCLGSCNLPTRDHDVSTTICHACGPKAVVRYCCEEHSFDDLPAHWQECGHPGTLLAQVIDEGSEPVRFRRRYPAIGDLNGLWSFQRHRQRAHAMRSKGQYTLFPNDSPPVIIRWPESEREVYEPRVERVLNIALLDQTKTNLVE